MQMANVMRSLMMISDHTTMMVLVVSNGLGTEKKCDAWNRNGTLGQMRMKSVIDITEDDFSGGCGDQWYCTEWRGG